MMKKRLLPLLLVFPLAALAADQQALEARIAELEREVANLKAQITPLLEKEALQQDLARLKDQARARMQQDREIYSRQERSEIERLYQVANKEWRSENGRNSLKQLVETYDRANRTGCALLYLGQMSEGEERLRYLKQAIDDYSDCFYGNGVQVGAYARFILGHTVLEMKKPQQAQLIFTELQELYPRALDHKGRRLLDLIPE